MDTVNLFLDTIGGRFHISPLVLMPMAVLLILNLMKYPAAVSYTHLDVYKRQRILLTDRTRLRQ